ncbi:MAG TPA: DivIVA domain-containing protein [Candidatus Acidoferrum sp.]|nr:DivIVA domain-containing protein [Candidatus Acidoferrum sp.]
MLTPTELKSKQFSRSLFGGYSMSDVDRLLDILTVDYEKLYTENAELNKKVEKLLDRLEAYEEQEESIKAAILNAQRMCDTIVKQAGQKAELIEIDAKAKSDKIMKSAEETVKIKEQELDTLQAEAGKFRERLVSIYREHLALITALPVYVEEKPAQLESSLSDSDAPQSEGDEGERSESGTAEPSQQTFEFEPEDASEETDSEKTMVFERVFDGQEPLAGEGAIPPTAANQPRPIATDVVELMAEEETEGYDEMTHLTLEDSLQFGPDFDIVTGKKINKGNG